MTRIFVLSIFLMSVGCKAQNVDHEVLQVESIRTKNLAEALLHVEKIKDLNYQTLRNETPLAIAANFLPDEKLIKKMVLKGADPNVSDRSGWHVLESKMSKGNMGLAKWLMEHGTSARVGLSIKNSDPLSIYMAKYALNESDFVIFEKKRGDICAENSRGLNAIPVLSLQ